jgi:excinuclease ABC subunit B
MPYAHSDKSEAIMHAAAPDVASRDKLEGGIRFVMNTEFEPAGDQPTASKNWPAAFWMASAIRCFWGPRGRGRRSPWPK